MQKQNCLVTDEIDWIKDGMEKLKELQVQEADLLFLSNKTEDESPEIQSIATSLPAYHNHKITKVTTNLTR